MGDGRAHQVLAVAVTFLVLSWLTVGARIWVRAGMIDQFGRDDGTMLVTQLLFTAYLICQLEGVVYGTGQHLIDLEPWRAEKALKFWYFCEVLYALSSIFLKVTIGYIILRVAVQPRHIWTARLVMIIGVVSGGVFAFVLIFQCWPIRSFWTLDPYDGHCMNSDVLRILTYTFSGMNIAMDWTLGILPVFVVKDLQISTRQKAMVACILAFAAIGSTATIVRLPYVVKISAGSEGDFLYDTVGLAIWSTTEIGVGVTAGCISTLRPLLRIAQQKLGIRDSGVGFLRHTQPSPDSASIPWPVQSPMPLSSHPKDYGAVTNVISCRGSPEVE